jgi:hypothetical protein
MTFCFVMNATILIVAAQLGHLSGSTSNIRRTSSAQCRFPERKVLTFCEHDGLLGNGTVSVRNSHVSLIG